jgi:hypothetical protein
VREEGGREDPESLVVRDGDELLALAEGREGCLDGQNSVFAQGRLDGLRIRALRQQELAVVFPVDGLCVGLLLMLGVDKKLVVNGLNNDLLRCVLRDVESELEHLVVTFILDQGAVEPIEPGVGVVLRAQRAVLSRRLLCRRAGGALEEVALAVHELAAEARHLLLHLPHLGVEALADVGELGVDDAEVAQLDGNVALDAAVRHFSRLPVTPRYFFS